jgi:hypothetical protein
MIRAFLLAALTTAAACTPPPEQVRIDAGPRPQVIKRPAVVPEGAEIQVVVVDSAWANAYRVADSLKDLEPAARAALFSAADLSKLSEGIPHTLRATAVSRARVETKATSAAPRALFQGTRRPEPAAEADSLLRLPDPLSAGAERGLRELAPTLREQRNSAANRVRQETDSVNSALANLSRQLMSDPGAVSVLEFIFNAPAHDLADRLAKDSLPGEASRLLLSAARGGSLAIPPHTLLHVLNATDAYGRRLNSLLAFVPTTVKTTSDELKTALQAIRGAFDEHSSAESAFAQADARLRGVAARLRDPSLEGTPPNLGQLASFIVAGVDLRPLLAGRAASDPELAAVREDLTAVRWQTERLVSVLGQLPRWTRNPEGAEVVLRQRYYGNKDVRLHVTRHPRFVTPVLEEGAGAPKPAGKNGTAEARRDGDAGQAGETDSTGAPRALSNTMEATVTTVHVPVVQRFRFQLGAGLMHSPLDTERFETREDSTDAGPGVYVRRSGVVEQRLAPVALLSYTIFPLSGKMFDARAYDARRSFGDYVRQAGLAVQLGLSMTNPTEEVFAGISTEPLPGLTVGWGYHTAYVQTSEHAGEFVPDSSGLSPTVGAWRSTWNAWTVGVDAKVFAQVFGSLLK